MNRVSRDGEPASPPQRGLGFGVELRRRREAAGLSQPALGRMINYDRTMISKVENGVELPSVAFAEAVDRALDAGAYSPNSRRCPSRTTSRRSSPPTRARWHGYGRPCTGCGASNT